jgi:hypothetical protein
MSVCTLRLNFLGYDVKVLLFPDSEGLVEDGVIRPTSHCVYKGGRYTKVTNRQVFRRTDIGSRL